MGLGSKKSFQGKGRGFHKHPHEHSVNALEGWDNRLKKEYGKPLSLKDATDVHQQRSAKSKKVDLSKKAQTILKPGTYRANIYLKNPNRYDVAGVDTIPGSKVHEEMYVQVRKEPLYRKGQKIYALKSGLVEDDVFTIVRVVKEISPRSKRPYYAYVVKSKTGSEVKLPEGWFLDITQPVDIKKPGKHKMYKVTIDGDLDFYYQSKKEADIEAKLFREREDVKKVVVSETYSRNYKLGDKYKEDFDYKGMLKAGMSANSYWSDEDLTKLHNSLESVNYHSMNRHLGAALSSKSEEARINNLRLFREECRQQFVVIDDIEPDQIEGGYSEGITSEHYDPEQLEKGTKVEMEHTNDPTKAKEIAKDHLKEFPQYYDHLDRMEKGVEKSEKAKEKSEKKMKAIDKLNISDAQKIRLKKQAHNRYLESEMDRANRGEVIDLTSLMASKENIMIEEMQNEQTKTPVSKLSDRELKDQFDEYAKKSDKKELYTHDDVNRLSDLGSELQRREQKRLGDPKERVKIKRELRKKGIKFRQAETLESLKARVKPTKETGKVLQFQSVAKDFSVSYVVEKRMPDGRLKVHEEIGQKQGGIPEYSPKARYTKIKVIDGKRRHMIHTGGSPLNSYYFEESLK